MGMGAGMGAGLRADATPEQKAFVEQFRAQRETVRAQVLEGKLTREQARAQMQKWAAEHRPKK
jgi:ribosomal protein L19E